jgi:two-component sensor histidine kinase
MDGIRKLIDDILDSERETLFQRQAQMRSNNAFAIVATALLIALILILIGAEANHARAVARELTEENQKLDVLVAERTLALEREKTRVQAFLADLNHRVGNTLVMASALINLQARKSTDENVKKALGESVERIRAIAASQRRLQVDADSDAVAAGPYIENVLDELRGTAEARGVKITTRIGDITLPGKEAVSYVLVINELAVNALKHAFADFDTGAIDVSLQKDVTEGGQLALVLTVADDGVGLKPGAGSGVGNSVLTLLVRAMNGTMRTEPASPGSPRPGLRTIITIPQPEPQA